MNLFSSYRKLGGDTMIVSVIVLYFSLSIGLFGAELRVRQDGSADFTSIQAAINAASAGDTVLVLDSATYTEDVTIGMLAPGQLESRANLVLAAAEGEQPVVQAANQVDRFALGAPDFGGLMVFSSGATVRGFRIINSGDPAASALGLATGLSIHASGVSIMDCEISQEGGTVGPTGAAVVAVADFGRLVGGGKTIDNVLIRDCVIENGTFIGISVFPFSHEVNPMLNDTVLGATVEGCLIRQCATTGLEADALGSITVKDTISEDHGGDGFQLAMEEVIVRDCTARGCGGTGLSFDKWDVGTGAAVTMDADGLVCLENGQGGLDITEGVATVSRLVAANNNGYNVRIEARRDLPEPPDMISVQIDHATLYYPSDQADGWPNILCEYGDLSPTELDLTNSLLVGPIGIDNYDIVLLEDDLRVDHTMYWNAGGDVENLGWYTETYPITPSDPQFANAAGYDFRIAPAAAAATADDAGGPLGGAGVISSLPDEVIITSVGIEGDQFYIEWEGVAGVNFEIVSGSGMNTDDWVTQETVAGEDGIQRWTDPREMIDSRFYILNAKN
jgi:hypothetical protein